MSKENRGHHPLDRFGFSHARGGAHAARTLMLVELTALLSGVEPPAAAKTDYLKAIQQANCLGKRSEKTRALTYRHLVSLYALDTRFALFRALRFFWSRDRDGQPLLAALCAVARDPLFRASADFILPFPEDALVTREALEAFIDHQEPGRFSPATLKSLAQNLNSSWTQSGHLCGRVRKRRSRARPTPGAVAFALFLEHLSGQRGESLFKGEHSKILDGSQDTLIEFAEDASRRGWMSFKRVGPVVEVRFPTLLTALEREWLRESN